jgi:hypothetical protein
MTTHIKKPNKQKNTIHGNDTQVSNTTENSIGKYNKYSCIPDVAFQ